MERKWKEVYDCLIVDWMLTWIWKWKWKRMWVDVDVGWDWRNGIEDGMKKLFPLLEWQLPPPHLQHLPISPI